MSIGLHKVGDVRSEAQRISAEKATRRILLRGVVYQAISWVWPPVALMKQRRRKEITTPVTGGAVSVVWRTKLQRRNQTLLGAMFR